MTGIYRYNGVGYMTLGPEGYGGSRYTLIVTPDSSPNTIYSQKVCNKTISVDRFFRLLGSCMVYEYGQKRSVAVFGYRFYFHLVLLLCKESGDEPFVFLLLSFDFHVVPLAASFIASSGSAP